jgi:aerobic C4-dicarboxylate transport protein
VINPALAPGMAMAPGIDKFMSERRALTNICGNGLAAIVVSASEGELDRAKLNKALADGAGVLEPAVAAAA